MSETGAWAARAVLAATLALPLSAASAQPAAAPAPQPSIQQEFEAAATASAAREWQKALSIFERLEARLAKGSARSLAIVRVRKAEALDMLGRDEEAAAALRLGLANLPVSDASLREDRYLALVRLGQISERELDFGEALKNYRLAEPLAEGREKAPALRGLIQTDMFYDAQEALAFADKGLAIAAAEPGDKPFQALFRTLRGRVLINLGRAAEARSELKKATDLLGGLTTKVDASDLAARSDLAIAALLAGADEAAREYLAWTGAGHFEQGFAAGAEMVPPPCGEDLEPGDVAVVEFSVRNDGTVGHALPIYASRQGPSALAFARAVRQWSWKPEDAAKIPPLFRALTRVELRCSTSGERPSLRDLLRQDVDAWLAARGLAPPADTARSSAARLKPLQEELARREAAAGAKPVALVPVLADLASNAIVPDRDRVDYLRRGLAIAAADRAPAPARAWFAIQLARSGTDWRTGEEGKVDDLLRALLASPDYAGDPRAAAAVRLELAEYLYRDAKRTNDAVAVLAPLRSAPGLGPNDPLRAAGLARLASLQLVAGDVPAARATFDASGLTADQCALLDTPPRQRSGAASSGDFPNEALRWGFEGWTVLQWDISPAGVPSNVRAVVAYPPFVFDKSGTKMIDRFRYEPTFRPGATLGCSGMTQRVRYQRGS
ncbi:MAG: energy transducer TonB [Alphaproteobacteria bacterium]|nr:energy transducer TonB [Alphaproteobacteria bacterium]MBV9372776.1 energy transducer TonB [Alphaproteobacteria bacterium]MBV9900217.1 energy transducer TonB [Alphaproteobacteria bacterium]